MATMRRISIILAAAIAFLTACNKPPRLANALLVDKYVETTSGGSETPILSFRELNGKHFRRITSVNTYDKITIGDTCVIDENSCVYPPETDN